MSQALKIIGISVIIMVVLFAIAAYALVSKFKQDVTGIEAMQIVRNAEVDRIIALPELRGVLVSGELVEAPFSRTSVAVCLLVQGRRLQLSGPTGGRSSGPGKGPTYAFEDDVVVLRGKGLALAVGGSTYSFDLDSLILSRPVSQPHDPLRTNGVYGDSFESNMLTSLFDHDLEQDLARLRALKGRSGLIDRYLRKEGRAGDPEVELEEVLFSIGDTISFHARIEGDRIVPLF